MYYVLTHTHTHMGNAIAECCKSISMWGCGTLEVRKVKFEK